MRTLASALFASAITAGPAVYFAAAKADATPPAPPAPAPDGSVTIPPVPAPIPVAAAPAPDGGSAPIPVAAAPAPVVKAPAAEILGIIASVPVPERRSGGRSGETKYDFDKMEVGQSFGIKNKSAKQIASTISSANKRYLRQKVDENGAPVFKVTEVKDSAGNVTKSTNEAVMEPSKVFVAANVDPTNDPQQANVRIWRKS